MENVDGILDFKFTTAFLDHLLVLCGVLYVRFGGELLK